VKARHDKGCSAFPHHAYQNYLFPSPHLKNGQDDVPFPCFSHHENLALIARKFLVTLCNTRKPRRAKQTGPYNRFPSGLGVVGFASGANSSKNENTLCSRFFRPQPLRAGRLTSLANSSMLRKAAPRICTFLQNLALRAIHATPTAPAAGLGTAGDCTAPAFAQKRDAKPVGGRGISAFSPIFYRDRFVAND